jgi:hypothetical protein
MGKNPVVTSEEVRATRTAHLAVCTCATPNPEVRAVWKGAARTHCSNCGLPLRLDFVAR